MLNESRASTGRMMDVIFLGTGTSQGVPVIGCRCSVCLSGDPRDRRARASAVVRLDSGAVVLIDSSPDLRAQALAVGLLRVDAAVYTHGHADHVMGLDDLRAFNQLNGNVIPCFGDEPTVATLRRVFGYAEIAPGQARQADLPGVTFHAVNGPFDLFGAPITPIPVRHARQTILGYRIGPMAYCTDCSAIPESSLPLLGGLEVMVLGALRRRPHPAHMSLSESLATAARIGARRTFFVHMNHDLAHEATNAALPADKQLAYDGLVVRVG